MFALVATSSDALVCLEFGVPIERPEDASARLRAILEAWPARRDELFDLNLQFVQSDLIARLKSRTDPPRIARATIAALGLLGRPQGAAEVIPFLDDPDRATVLTAIHSLGQMGWFPSIPSVERFLADPEFAVRAEAITALGKFAKPELAPALFAAAGDDPALRARADESELRARVTATAIATERWDLYVDVVLATDQYEDLAALMPLLVARLVHHLESPATDPVLRRRAADVLYLGRGFKSARSMSLIAVDDAMPMDLRRLAVQALGRFGYAWSWSTLGPLVGGAVPELQEDAIVATGRLGVSAAVDALVAQWNARGGALRAAIRLALRRLSSPSAAALLVELASPGSTIALRGLWMIDDTLSLSPRYRAEWNETYLEDRDAAARRDAIVLLGLFGNAADAPRLRALAAREADAATRDLLLDAAARVSGAPREASERPGFGSWAIRQALKTDKDKG